MRVGGLFGTFLTAFFSSPLGVETRLFMNFSRRRLLKKYASSTVPSARRTTTLPGLVLPVRPFR